jgi:uncharacterized protein (TIGR02117 family)
LAAGRPSRHVGQDHDEGATVRTAVRWIVRLLALVAVAAALGTLLPRPLWRTDDGGGQATRRIYVLSNPIHTDIAIPVDAALLERFRFLSGDGIPIGGEGVRYLVFGWGGRAFYLETPTWSQLKPAPVLKALTMDASVMHVDVAGTIPEPHPAVAGYDISEPRFSALLDFIEASFARGQGGPVFIPGAGYAATDGFYEANGAFNALVGCNTWTAKALRIAGLRTGWWNPLPWSLGLSMQLYNHDQARTARP